ncbi:MAG: hypothetical protein JWR26_3347 [Pedosphaera sp.]|nr:hypothetical protein [Pedosphaera sp.]
MNIINSSWRETEGYLQQEVAGHHGERAQLGARWRGLGRRASKVKCHLSPPSPPAKRAGGEGVGLERLVAVARLEAAWVLGFAGAMDVVDGMDAVDARDRRDEGFRLEHGQRVVWQPQIRQCPGLSPIVPDCPGVFLFSFFRGCPTLGRCGCPVSIWAGAWKRHAITRNHPRPPGVIYFFVFTRLSSWAAPTTKHEN